MGDVAVFAATLATATLLGHRLFAFIDARWETEAPYWDAVREALGEGYSSDNQQPMVVVHRVIDWAERGWA